MFLHDIYHEQRIIREKHHSAGADLRSEALSAGDDGNQSAA
jgi:hypothetical protein